MALYRVLAEQSDLYEIYVEARNAEQAIKKAQEADFDEFELFDTRAKSELVILTQSVERA